MSSPEVDRFVQLLAESRLVDDARLERTRARAREQQQPEVLARRLVHRGHLTRWQARVLLGGKNGPFFMANYRLLKPLGQGGMGTVYKAVHPKFRRTVAIKVLTLADQRSLTRFQREIRAVAALDHPHIVHAFDADRAGNVYFLVMEYVQGRDLKRWVDTAGPLPIGWSCECIRQAALGLQYAHERQIVHRDIKPSNLLLVHKSLLEPPHVKIADFGLARARLDVVENGGLTRVGQGLGTSEYIAPEQAQDSTAADIRSDIYSLGCTLFELLTGRFPFGGDSSFERLIARFKEDPPPVSSLRAEVPRQLDGIIARMLQRDPQDRYQTPTEVAEVLSAFADAGAPPRKPAGAPPPAGCAGDQTPRSDVALEQFLVSLSSDASRPSLPSLSKSRPKLTTRRLWTLFAAAAAFLSLLAASWALINPF